MNVLLVGLGGALGSMLRYGVGVWMAEATNTRAPATFLVNIVGSFIIGVILVASAQRSWSNTVVVLVAVGFLGGFTTFSALTAQTYALLESGHVAQATLNIGASITVGMLAVWAGASLAKAM